MKRFVICVLISLLSGCAESGTPTSSENGGKVFGWRSAGLVLPDANSTGGVHKLTHVGDVLFAMDAYTPHPVLDTSRPYQYRIWKGHVGSQHWDSLPMPKGNFPNGWVVLGERLLVGTRYTGEVWAYDPATGKWDSLPVPASKQGPTRFPQVTMMGVFGNKLVMGVIAYGGYRSEFFSWIGDPFTGQGTMIPGIGDSAKLPVSYVQEFSGALFGIHKTYGVFRYNLGDPAWEQLPSPRGRTATVTVDPCAQGSSALGNVVKASCPTTSANPEDEFASLLGVHDSHLYVGYTDYKDGLYRWNGDGTWRKMTPVSDTLNLVEAPRDIRSFESYRGRMYMSGTQYSTPLLWKPKDTAVPHFGDWMNLPNGWCRDEYGCGSQTWGLMGLGDTLYAIGWGFVAKVPLSEIDSMAVHQYDPKFYK